jgi:hypothetical protein
MMSASAIAVLEPLGHQCQHLALPAGEGRIQHGSLAARSEELGHDLGIEGGPSSRNALERFDEVADIRHPILEQVPDAGGALGEQLGGVAGLAVLGEHQHADVGMLTAKGDRGAQSFVGVGGRHADVHHRHIRVMLGHCLQQGVPIGDRGRDLVPTILQNSDEALSHDGGVLGDHDAHRARLHT